MKERYTIIENFMECNCLNYEEAKLVLINYIWNKDKLIEIWYNETEKIKIESNIQQSDKYEIFPTEEVKDENALFLKCNHKTCNDCLIAYIYEILYTDPKSILQASCPFKGYNLHLTSPICQLCIISSKIEEIYSNISIDNYIETNKNIKIRPNKKCKYLVKAQNSIAKEIICKCGLVFCFSCLKESHIPCNWEMAKHFLTIDEEIIQKM